VGFIIQAIDDFLDVFASEKGKGEIIMSRPAGIGTAHIIGTQGSVNSHFVSVCFYCSET
jgi:hypothetical protein